MNCMGDDTAALESSRSRDDTGSLAEWNDTHVAFPLTSGLHTLFESQVTQTPAATAVVCGDTRLSYAELNARANRLGHYLRAQGVGPDVLVGIYLERGIDAVVAILGVLKAGGAYLPLDASYPKDRLSYIMDDAAAPVLLTKAAYAAELSVGNAHVACLDGDPDLFGLYSQTDLPTLSQPHHLAFVLYTSGSTGNPKGVEITHGNMINNFFAWEHICQLRATIHGVCQAAYFSFAVFQGDLFRALCAGKKLVIFPNEVLMSPARMLQLMRSEQVDFGEFVPTLLRSLVEHVKTCDQTLDFMRVIIVSADRWYVREHAEVSRLGGPNTRLLHVYGLSETTLDSTYFTATASELNPAQLTPIGRPFPNVQVYILDQERRQVPVGVTGELYVGGAGVARGYHARPELTAERFITNPFSTDPQDRLYYTGDLASYLPDGNIAFFGRSDAQVKISGFRVELGEIEAQLESFPGIRQAVVRPWEPAPGRVQLAAYYVSNLAVPPDARQLRQFLANKLAPFMVPASFQRLDALPLTPSNKVDRNALPAPLAAIAAEDVAEAELTPMERALSRIWAEILKLDHVGPDVNFFAVGGDSLRGLNLVARAEEIGVQFSYSQLFHHPTISELAAVAEFIAPPQASPPQQPAKPAGWMLELSPTQLQRLELASDAIEDVLPLSPTQQGIYMQGLMGAAKFGAYIEQASYTLQGKLDVAAMQHTWQKLVEHCATLRTSFVRKGLAKPAQIVHKTASLEIQRYDYQGLTEADQQQRVADQERLERAQPLDLAHPPLMRVTLIDLGPARSQLICTYHHIILDGWSKYWLMDTLFRYYGQLANGAQVDWTAERPFRDYLHWVNEQQPEADEAFWRSYLGGFTRPNQLCTAANQPDTAQPAGFGTRQIALESAAFEHFCRCQRLTLNSFMQGMWALALGRLSGDQDVLYGTVVAGRTATIPGMRERIGLFVNTLPVRTRIDRDTTVANWLQEMQHSLVQLSQREHIPLALIQKWSDIPPASLPMINALFVVLNMPANQPNAGRAGGIEVVAEDYYSAPHYPLTLFLVPGERLTLRLVYRQDMLSDHAVNALVNNLTAMMQATIEAPDSLVASILKPQSLPVQGDSGS